MIRDSKPDDVDALEREPLRERKPLRVLIVEDSDDDAQVVCRQLRLGGYDPDLVCVETAEDLRVELQRRDWDVILSDFSLPHFSAWAALKLARDLAPEVPVLIVSGTIGEEAAVDLMRAGARDCILKQNLSRLVPAIERERRDVAEKKQRDEQLRRSEARFHRLFESNVIGIGCWNEEGAITEANDALLQVIGFTREEFQQGKVCYRDITPVEHHHRDEQAVEQIRANGFSPPFEKEYVRKDGSRVPVLIGAVGYLEDGPLAGVFFVVDLSERKRLEEQLRRAAKMEAIGQLAGGVAHEFNNLLTIIAGYSEMLLKRIGSDDSMHGIIDQIQQAGGRAAALTQQLQALSHKQIMVPQVVDLNGIVSETEKLLRRLLGDQIDIATVLDPRLGYIEADAGQLEQVIVNLAINARDAMPPGGKLVIETRNIRREEKDAAERRIPPGSYVLLQVRDNGCGMSAEVKAHLFEPFFTTKQHGRGSGLGLAAVQGIVKQSRGHIEVDSSPGSGTTFRLYFPRVDAAPPASFSAQGVVVPTQGAETILLVEDDPGVRALAAHVLEGCGYTVLEAPNGVEAVRVGERYTWPIHLLLTDVVMPEMRGTEAAVRLLRLHPETRVLYVSGYSAEEAIDELLSAGGLFLQKPFSPSDLAAKVREALDKPRREAGPGPAPGQPAPTSDPR